MRVFGIEKKILFFSFLGVFLSSLAVQAGNINPDHDSPQTQAGDCMYCHVSPDTGPTLPKQAACLNCHVRWNPGTTSLEVVGLQQEYGLPPMEMLAHEIFSNSGDEIKIYDLAVCFSCHSDPAKATVITPYHGAKVNGVVWSDNLEDPNDDPYAMFYYHPGRNTFNVMSYVFNNRNGSFNSKLLDGYESLTNCAGQTAKDLGKSEDNLCVPVPRYRDAKGDTWEFPVPGYELRVTIPFDNFGVDSSPTFIDVPFFPEISPPSSACPDTDADGWAVCDGSCDETGLTCGDVCPDDPAKTDDAGQCGCGVADTDSDGDGTADCNDNCPADPDKTDPGTCGCGVADTDSDGDGTPDCNDNCSADPDKTDPGTCGCGVADTDSDGDGTPDCNDNCSADPGKTDPGQCGCGLVDTDTDGDGTADCNDICPNDPTDTCQTPPCPDVDADGWAVCDASCDSTGLTCGDVCPDDPAKTIDAGQCGCGVADIDTDGDGTADCNDACPNDPDNDIDGDGVCGNVDACPVDPAKSADAGQCGCGVSDTDTDGDGTADCNDICPNDPDNDIDGDGVCGDVDACPADPAKAAEAGQCGCGVADTDTDGDGTADCNDICPNDPTDSCQSVVCSDQTAKGDCQLYVECEWVGKPKTGSCQDAASPVDPEVCDDGIDNDGDGQTDCDDSDCAGVGSCPAPAVCIDHNGDEASCLADGCRWNSRRLTCK